MADITTMISELREMVDASVNPNNGAKSITGQSVNLAMHSLIDAIEAAASTGGGGKFFDFPRALYEATGESQYTFSADEQQDFLAAFEDDATTFRVNVDNEGQGNIMLVFNNRTFMDFTELVGSASYMYVFSTCVFDGLTNKAALQSIIIVSKDGVMAGNAQTVILKNDE